MCLCCECACVVPFNNTCYTFACRIQVPFGDYSGDLMSNVLGVQRGACLYIAGHAKQSFLRSAGSVF